MPASTRLSTSTLSQKGAAHLLVPIILLIGIAVTLYLVSHPAIFKPKAGYEADPSQAVSVNGKKCSNNECEAESTSVELTIDVDGLNTQIKNAQ